MRIAILDDIEGAALKMADWKKLGTDFKIDVYQDNLPQGDRLIQRLLPYDILVIMRERTRFPRSLIEALPNLKLLLTSGSRNNAIDLATCKEKGIVVCGTDSSKQPPAELTWGLILALMRRIPQMDAALREGRWGDGIGTDLSDKILGILGLGRLGTKVASVGIAFGMKVIAWSQNLTADAAASVGAVRVEKEELFAESDILSVHVVLSDRSRGMIGREELSLMKPTAVIINTSRGPIIHEQALVEALSNGKIAGAALDVFDTEPLPLDHPFLSLPNTLVTPHIGYVTRENFNTYFDQSVENIIAWREGKPIRVLNPSG